MPRKTLYPDTTLNLKIKKHENADEKRKVSFGELCRFYGLDSSQFNPNDPSPWRQLATAMMEHLVPAFKRNKSGAKRKHSLASDHELIADYLVFRDFGSEEKCISKGGKVIWLAGETGKDIIKRIAYNNGIKEGQVEAALDRHDKLFKANPTAYYASELADNVPEYVLPTVEKD